MMVNEFVHIKRSVVVLEVPSSLKQVNLDSLGVEQGAVQYILTTHGYSNLT